MALNARQCPTAAQAKLSLDVQRPYTQPRRSIQRPPPKSLSIKNRKISASLAPLHPTSNAGSPVSRLRPKFNICLEDCGGLHFQAAELEAFEGLGYQMLCLSTCKNTSRLCRRYILHATFRHATLRHGETSLR